MKLSDYIRDADTKPLLAQECGTTPDYLWQIATGWRGRRASVRMAIAIERATSGAVRCEDLRPDVDWLRDPTGQVTGYHVRIDPAGKPAKAA